MNTLAFEQFDAVDTEVLSTVKAGDSCTNGTIGSVGIWALGGAALGATIGSGVGPEGSVAGAVVGGVIGGIGGAIVGYIDGRHDYCRAAG
ncbi:Blp family class II bacteriocin [Streptococcus tangpeifui]|uniref:Blp family class II bacteriocin n=1 Tax=Streptococcus tangpeifui TaxID=2709400 RepID=UPI0013ED637C|nr:MULTISPECIES: Blp family class II bacteriocin [unclassified Streptococcus]